MSARPRLIGLLLAALVLVPPPRAEAVVVELHDKGRVVHGKLVQLTPQLVVVDQISGDGTSRRLQFSREEIATLTLNVSDDRLAALDPANPQGYFQYAEELSALREDPDARETAIRLYLIAGDLDSERFGDQALNGLIGLARTAAEERLLRAMRHLQWAAAQLGSPSSLADQRDRALLQTSAVDGLLKCIRAVRSGDRRKALEILARGDVRDALSRIHCGLTADDIQRLAHGECSACIDGRVDCDRCAGQGKVQSASGQVPCVNCRGMGLAPCAACRGRDFFTRPSQDALQKLLALELHILRHRAGDEVGAGDRRRRADDYRNWSLAQHKRAKAVLILNWSNVTEFDPRESVYVGNRWSRP